MDLSRATGLFAPVLMILAACVPSPEAFETEPVEVATDKGVVTCQLYSANLVTWDRAIDRPEDMTVAEADAICKAEGTRQEAEG